MLEFRVTPLFDKGQQVAQSEIPATSSNHGFVTFEDANQDGELLRCATLTSEFKKPLLPPLLYPQVVELTSFVMRIRGYERLRTSRGIYDVRQEWLCEMTR